MNRRWFMSLFGASPAIGVTAMTSDGKAEDAKESCSHIWVCGLTGYSHNIVAEKCSRCGAWRKDVQLGAA